MKIMRNTFTLCVILLLVAGPQACMPGKQLITTAASPAQVQGTYTLLLYGCRYADDIENVAILVNEGSGHPVEIYAPDFMYKTRKGLSGSDALTQADAFVRCSFHKIWQTELFRIPDDAGGTIGYEVRALYVPYEFGQADVLLVSYRLKDGKVVVNIRLDPDVERTLDSSGSRERSGKH